MGCVGVSKPRYPEVVTTVRVKYEISDSVTVALWMEIRLSQSERFHIIGQAISYRSRVERLSPLMPPGWLHPSSFASPPASLHQLKLPLLSLIYCTSSASIAFHFSVMRFFSYWLRVAEVCDRPLRRGGEMGLVTL